MSALVWTAFGITLGAAVLHATLGLRRPFDRMYLSFACLLLALAAYMLFEARLYHSTTVSDAIAAERGEIAVANVALGCFLVFIPAYTHVRLPRWLVTVYWGALGVSFVANLWMPYSLWYSEAPTLVPATLEGERYETVRAPPLGLVQYAWALLPTSMIVIALGCAWRLIAHGDRQRGAILMLSLVLVLLDTLFDVVRDALGGTWPYVAEYGVVGWGVIMSVQLAYDYRRQADALTRAIAQVAAQASLLAAMLDAMRALERNMDAPLDTLESGVATLVVASGGRDHIAPMSRAVTRLRELRRSMGSPTDFD